MANLTVPGDMLTIRQWIATDLGDPELELLSVDLGDVGALDVAYHLIRTELTLRLSRPSSWSLSGDYSEQWLVNIAQLRKDAERLESLITPSQPIPGAPVLSEVGSIMRSDRDRIADLA